MAVLNSFPNNSDVYQGAEEVMRWLHGRTKGVYAGANNAAVTAIGGVMGVSVSKGIGWITDENNDGIVWWFDEAQELEIDPAEGTGTLSRIDRIVVEWRTVDYSDLPELKVLKGTNASNPVAPALTNSNILRQLSLAQISIPAGTTEITDALITDERQDPDVCGIVTESVTADTTVINNQFQAFLASIQQELNDLQADVAVELKKLMFEDTTVSASSFLSDATYADYPYRAAVALPGAISGMIPEVILGLSEAISGNFAPIAESYNGGVYIYAQSVPDAAITIPTIILWRENA